MLISDDLSRQPQIAFFKSQTETYIGIPKPGTKNISDKAYAVKRIKKETIAGIEYELVQWAEGKPEQKHAFIDCESLNYKF